jgi:hypothetical protein
LLGQSEQFLRSGAQVASAAGVGQTKGLARFDIQEEEGLDLLGGRLRGAGTTLQHVPFGVTDQAVRIQCQDLAREMAAGPAQLAQAHLEFLGLLDRVGFQQVMQGAIGGQPRQAIGQFKAPVPQRAVGAEGRSTQCGFVYQVQR